MFFFDLTFFQIFGLATKQSIVCSILHIILHHRKYPYKCGVLVYRHSKIDKGTAQSYKNWGWGMFVFLKENRSSNNIYLFPALLHISWASYFCFSLCFALSSPTIIQSINLWGLKIIQVCCKSKDHNPFLSHKKRV